MFYLFLSFYFQSFSVLIFMCVSYKQHIIGFLLSLTILVFRPPMFKVIMYTFGFKSTILLIIPYLSHLFLCPFSLFLPFLCVNQVFINIIL